MNFPTVLPGNYVYCTSFCNRNWNTFVDVHEIANTITRQLCSLQQVFVINILGTPRYSLKKPEGLNNVLYICPGPDAQE